VSAPKLTKLLAAERRIKAADGNTIVERAMATEGAADHREATLTLPAGWLQRTDSDGTYYRRVVAHAGHIDATAVGAYLVPYAEMITDPERVHMLGQVLGEAADIVVQLQAGAR